MNTLHVAMTINQMLTRGLRKDNKQKKRLGKDIDRLSLGFVVLFTFALH